MFQVRHARLPLRLPAGVSPAAHSLNCPPDLLSSQPHPSTLPPVNIPHVPFLPKPEALSCIRKCFLDCPPAYRMVILYMTQPSGHQGRQWGQGCNPAGVVRTKQDPQFHPHLTPTLGPPSPQKERQPECHGAHLSTQHAQESGSAGPWGASRALLMSLFDL